MHFKNARNASVYAVFRAFFTQSLAKLRFPTPENNPAESLAKCRNLLYDIECPQIFHFRKGMVIHVSGHADSL